MNLTKTDKFDESTEPLLRKNKAPVNVRQIELGKIEKHLPSNEVKTSRYTALSFLPVNLVEQLKKPSNLYFLLIMFLQMVPVISISGGQPAMLPPLVCVVLISMGKDAYEDYLKHQKDREENESIASQVKATGDAGQGA